MDAKKPDYTTGPPPLLRTLILEDNPHDAKLMVALLQSGGYKVQSTVLDLPESFREHLEIAEYDVILADFNLRNWTALDALEILKRSGKDTPLIVVTGSLGDESAVECIKRGAMDFVLKDRPARLPTAVQRALEEKRLSTEKKRAEEALIEERHLLHTLMDNLPDLIYFKDRESRFTRINLALAKKFDLDHPAQAIGKTDFDFLPAEHAKEFLKDDAELLRTGQPIVGKEEKGIWPDGHVTWVSTTKMLLRDANGNIIGTFGVSRDITERKRAEESLRESEERFRSTFENAGIGMALVDMQGHPIKSNPALQQMLGYDAEELSHMVFTEYTHPDDRELDWGLFGELAAGKRETYEIEKRFLKKGGDVVWGLLTASLVKDRQGCPVCAVGMVQDISERKRAEEGLRASEEKYRSLVSNIPDVVWTVDAELRFVFISKNIERISGYSPDEVYQQGIRLYLDSLLPDDVHKVREGFRALFAEGRPFDVECRVKRKDGEWIWVHDRALVTYEKNGIRYADGLLSDITERKKAEAEHIRLVTAIEQSAEAVVITNTNGDIEYVNPAFTRITGYSREEVLGQNPRLLKSGKQDRVFYQQLWTIILRGDIWHGELINRRKDGNLYTEEMTIAPVRDALGEVTHFIATKQDVTEHKRLEQQLIQAQKMEAVGRLAGGVAHDFNNLLTIINGYAALLSEQTSTEDPRRARLKEILMAGERAASLTRQLLAFSRRQVLEPRVLDLNSVIATIEKMLRRLIGEDVELVTTLRPDIGRVKVDPGQIEQVVMNLAVNARDAMPEGGKLLIETSNVEIDANYTRSHSPMIPGKYVMMAVDDTGCGMDLETQAHIFEPFFTTKEESRGTGLGLATVYGIVKQSGGFIWVYSAPGCGSTFKIYLPIVEEALPTAEPAEVPAELAKGVETLLVVEDEGGVRSLLCETLAAHGYKVLEAAGAAQAFQIAEQHTEPIHLLLTDVVMPQTGGKELVKRLSTLHPETKVLYMSGYTDDAIVRHGILEGGTPFLQKPFSPKALLAKVREVLRMKS
jgi:PAS domain S-box-containing protein